jgi:hypothetical protein
MQLLTERYARQILGTLSCYDRLMVTGTLPGVCHAEGMASYLRAYGILFKDFPRFAEPLRDEIRENAERLARENRLEIEFIRRHDSFRKEDRIQEILRQRGDHPGLVHIFSAMERCSSYEGWHDKQTGKNTLRHREGKCLHYYFYFIDPEFGLCFLRVPTWVPFRLQFYCNGHSWLAARLREAGIAFTQLDNTFTALGDFARAQELADTFSAEALHRLLDRLVQQYCPVLAHFGGTYHWSLMQVEYATDIVFRRQRDLQPLYDALVRTAVHAVKAEHVATFLGRKLHPLYQDEVGNDFHTRIQGTRIKHRMGPAALKMYDKQGLVLRLETTANDVSFFKHYREVEHRDGTKQTKLAPMQKTIHSLGALRELLTAANRRYLAFLSDLLDPSAGVKKVEKLASPARKDDRTYRGFNPFDKGDLDLFVALCRGEWQISGFQNRSLRRFLTDKTGPQVSRLLKRLHVHGLIRKMGRTYKYYLTKFGQEVVLTALKLRELVVIPSLAGVPVS